MAETLALGRTAKRQQTRGWERSPYRHEPVDHGEDWPRPSILSLASLLKLNLLGSRISRKTKTGGNHGEFQRSLFSRVSDPDRGGSSRHRIDGRARPVRSPVQQKEKRRAGPRKSGRWRARRQGRRRPRGPAHPADAEIQL